MKISNTFITALINNHVKTLSKREYIELRTIVENTIKFWNEKHEL